MAAGSWSLTEELFTRGDAGFVDELRRVHHAERLAAFAPRWIDEARPFARASLIVYLSRPLNCFRHEPLVKRLFKLAEQARDDELMGVFMAAFDRSIRQKRATRSRYKYGNFASQAEAEAAVRTWEAEGFELGSINNYGGRFHANAWKQEPTVVATGRAMPRPPERERSRNQPIPDALRLRLERRHILFSLPTRRYLRRRAWRYFRLLGKTDPARYLRAATAFLNHYTDADIDSDLHLLDNWGLTHALFHHSPALEAAASGWRFAEGKSAADISPAPYLESAWAADPAAVFDVLLSANCRAVRQWAIAMIRRHHADWLAAQPVTTLLKLADHPDADLAALGFDLLEKVPDLARVPIEEWLTRLNGDDLEKLRRLSDLLTRRLDASRIAATDAIRLAAHRSKPVAELGLRLLRERPFTVSNVPLLLSLVQAESEAVRPELVKWLKSTLAGFGTVPADWVIEFIDSKHADVRAVGWEWLTNSPLCDEPGVWQKLIESPYEDVRGPLVTALAARVETADPDRVRMLWATALVNIARGGRQKPAVVRRVVDRLADHPGEVDRLLPLLAVAVRSIRGPEFRAGLAGVVGLAERRPELMPAIRERFPELEFNVPAFVAG